MSTRLSGQRKIPDCGRLFAFARQKGFLLYVCSPARAIPLNLTTYLLAFIISAIKFDLQLA